MKKAIIVLVGMAVICIAAIGIMYLPEKIVDANSSSTIVQIENTCPAQPEPVNIVPNNASNEVPILTYIQYDSLSNLLHDLLNGEIGKNSSISGPLIYHIDKNEIELWAGLCRLTRLQAERSYIVAMAVDFIASVYVPYVTYVC